MIHRLALLMGGAGAAGVLALALGLNGSASPTNAFVPVANDVTAADQLALAPPTDLPAPSVKKQVDTIYVLPAPKPVVLHTNKPAGGKDNQPSDTPRPARNDGGGNVAGDDGQDDEAGDSADDQAGGQDEHDDGGSEPGDD